MKKLEEIWIIIAWIPLFPFVLMLKLLGKLIKKSERNRENATNN